MLKAHTGNSRPSITDVAIKRRLFDWLDVGVQNQRGNKRKKLPIVVETFRSHLHFQDRPEAKKKLSKYLSMVETTTKHLRNEIERI